MNKQERFQGRRKYLPVFFGLISILLFISLFSEAEYDLYSVQLRFAVSLAPTGSTVFVLPLIGSVRAHTHFLPFEFAVTLQNIDLATLRSLVFATPEILGKIEAVTIERIRQAVLIHMLRLAILGALGAMVGVWVIGIKRFLKIFIAALCGFVFVSILLMVTYVTYDLDAFETPSYQGIIEAAPWMLSLVQESLERVEELGEQVGTLARNLYGVLQELENVSQIGLGEIEVLVLHVSDIHNNPVAYDFAVQVINSFPVDFIIDTGDLTDWGTKLESEIVVRISDLDIPYVFTTGNHDSPDVLARLQQTDNVVLVEYGEQNVQGLRILGIGDAVADSYSPQVAPLDELDRISDRINDTWRHRVERPDIFIVHNNRIARRIEPGIFPVVLYGHNHLLSAEQEGETVYVNAGTTGAAGIRGFSSREPLPYSLSLLHFSRDGDGDLRLSAVDGIHVAGLGTGFSLERTFIDNGRNLEGNVEPMNGML